MDALWEYDEAVRNSVGIFCGVDEAGRGPLAGDVYAAAVILNPDNYIEGLNDSKKLSEKKREKLYDEIIEKAEDYCIARATIAEIEEINILNAAMLAMKRAVLGLETKPALVLADGNKTPDVPCEARAVVKGDGNSASIAAASILARLQGTGICLKWRKSIRNTDLKSIRDTVQNFTEKKYLNLVLALYTDLRF